MSKFKDESLYFHFHADKEMEGTRSKNKQLCSDFKLVENILAKWLVLKCTDAEEQLHRYAIFCQALVATMCTFSEQLLEALSYGYNNNGENEESSRRQPQVKEKWAMLEDICVTLSELESVTFSFKQLDENCVANTNVFYHIEGSQQALKVVFYLNGYHFSKLPSHQENRASLQPHTVLFTKG
ncbi:Phosphatidylinositol 3,4,5-trisphosphate-dependent Rac exchanger 1 protein [Sciurus carolinensis]|uniref:Phosphatidylinositol 3,4,5-trisphosphate-dependent Rac exchanger 1 protein n=1 Tax=Sciurus carolinensis TaxID=30640 RepID=A0AA41MFQ9_SCICA|nr:Phosphatidylinositol 3,4,5-trisphosphate-dependent Rac exchanger 1 protein [Sciurus carolinensis]